MTWTTDVPAQAGQYWMKVDDSEPCIVGVFELPATGYICLRPALIIHRPGPLTGREQWQGPIVPPE